MKNFIKKYIFYIIRWQLSTPILAIVLIWLANQNKWVATIIANFIGALIFFWVDRIIFKTNFMNPLWEVKENIACHDCGEICRGYRLIKDKNYDRINDNDPEFRCEACSIKKQKSKINNN
jgi:hypothetical protein